MVLIINNDTENGKINAFKNINFLCLALLRFFDPPILADITIEDADLADEAAEAYENYMGNITLTLPAFGLQAAAMMAKPR